MRYFTFFSYLAFEIQCAFYTLQHISVQTGQVSSPQRHMRPVATILDGNSSSRMFFPCAFVRPISNPTPKTQPATPPESSPHPPALTQPGGEVLFQTAPLLILSHCLCVVWCGLGVCSSICSVGGERLEDRDDVDSSRYPQCWHNPGISYPFWK